MSRALAGKIALVTGASRGIGAAIAHMLAAQGAQIIVTARTVGALEELDDAVRAHGITAAIVPLDLRDLDAIDALGGKIYERYGRLDILIGNAGTLGSLTPLAHVSPSELEDVFTVNVLANARLLRSCDPLLRASPAARVVMVTSAAASRQTAYWGPYGASKAALEHLTLTYAAEVDRSKLRVNLLDPGATRTAMRARAFPGEDPARSHLPELVAQQCLTLLGPDAPHGTRLRVG